MLQSKAAVLWRDIQLRLEQDEWQMRLLILAWLLPFARLDSLRFSDALKVDL